MRKLIIMKTTNRKVKKYKDEEKTKDSEAKQK